MCFYLQKQISLILYFTLHLQTRLFKRATHGFNMLTWIVIYLKTHLEKNISAYLALNSVFFFFSETMFWTFYEH